MRARALSVQLSRVAVEEGGEIPALVDQQSDDASPFFRVEYQRRDAILAHLVPYSFMTRLMTFAATVDAAAAPHSSLGGGGVLSLQVHEESGMTLRVVNPLLKAFSLVS